VSARAFPSRGRLCWSVGREGGAPPGAARRIWLVGKQSTNSNRRILAGTSFPTEWSARVGLCHDASSLPWLPLQGVYLGGLRRANQARSDGVCLLRDSSNTTTRLFSSKFCGCHDLPIVAGLRGLTAESLKRYIPVRRGRSSRGGLSKSPNGPVEGLSPEILESAA